MVLTVSSSVSSREANFVQTLVDLLRYRSIHQPSRIAYIFLPDESNAISINYEELDRKARAIASRLKHCDVENECVLLLYPAGLDYISAFFGCLYAGAIAVPAYPLRPNRSIYRIESLMADSGAKIALSSTKATSSIKRCFNLVPKLNCIDWVITNNIKLSLSNEWSPPTIDGNTIAYLQYTSGSTSSPKGVMISHHNVLYNTFDMAQTWEVDSDSVLISWLPHFHDFGLVFGILEPIYSGCTGILMSPESFIQKPIRWLQTISKYKGTHSGAPNFAYDLCAERQATIKDVYLDLSSWKVAVNGAEPIHYQTLVNFVTAFEPCGFSWEAFSPGYGLAEATLKICSVRPHTRPTICTVQSSALKRKKVVEDFSQSLGETQKIIGCGRPILSNQVIIVDPESLLPCAPDSIGEIWISSNSVAQGYWQNLEATEKIFNARSDKYKEKPFLRTGDLGFLKDGELFVMGRLKDLIIIRGRNYYPQDLELSAQQSHPAIRAGFGAAFTIEAKNEERLVLVLEVERKFIRNSNVTEIAQTVAQAIAEKHEIKLYALALVKTGSIPKTSSGKIQRYVCQKYFKSQELSLVGQWQEELVEEQFSETNFQVSKSKKVITQWLIGWISKKQKLSADTIKCNQTFSSYGLDSLDLIKLTENLEAWLNCSISPTVISDNPSIDSLANYLDKE